jgi:hypothetical protein
MIKGCRYGTLLGWLNITIYRGGELDLQSITPFKKEAASVHSLHLSDDNLFHLFLLISYLSASDEKLRVCLVRFLRGNFLPSWERIKPFLFHDIFFPTDTNLPPLLRDFLN